MAENDVASSGIFWSSPDSVGEGMNRKTNRRVESRKRFPCDGGMFCPASHSSDKVGLSIVFSLLYTEGFPLVEPKFYAKGTTRVLKCFLCVCRNTSWEIIYICSLWRCVVSVMSPFVQMYVSNVTCVGNGGSLSFHPFVQDEFDPKSKRDTTWPHHQWYDMV